MRLSSLLLLLLLVSLRVPQRLDDRGRGRLCINLERDVGGDDLAGAFGVAFPFRFRRLGGLLSSSEDDREASRNGWWLCLRGCRLLLFRRDNSVLFLSTKSSSSLEEELLKPDHVESSSFILGPCRFPPKLGKAILVSNRSP